ncbi:uroporphyrinogen-III C-methyltransferase [Desulfonatronovibrio hydrogenovorans]|uniref:uroporphyrinogen-III C-methyltransferase n=1 Tax=Desulfonatronovibrio hydrogenovorans TaxID=53245 RepID=UPI00048EC1CF|nr:uroporphyrinogen-III C-methyltransferase [Desulfonatronovibrio hydrogenovorans]
MSKVYLIGAGPGDPGLLTIKAREILERADVVVYDYLANEVFLKYCRKDAQIIYVGKKGGDHTLPQDKINDLLVEKALQGKMVARLKGGDPYIFGRGAEEAQELLEAGADFEVVPGVTSAVAAPAYAGIPLTHRKYASSVSFITGHEDPNKPESAHNWKSLASGTSTLVFFMGVKNLPHISRMLMENGMRPDMPAALVRWGTTCRHRSMVSTIKDIPQKAVQEGFKPPSLLVVGEVVQLRDELNWFERLPLLGKGVVVTRAREQASGLLKDLSDLGACCFEFPTIEIKPLSDYQPLHRAINSLSSYDWLIFTSVNGVIYFWQELRKMGLDARALGRNRVAAIGPATAAALEQRGVFPDFVPDKYVAESVVDGLLKLGVQGKKVLIPRARVAREVLPMELEKAGAHVEILPVYETGLAQEDGQEILAGLENRTIHYVTFTSSSTVENFFSLISAEKLKPYVDKGLKLVCIGPVTAKTLERSGFKADLMPRDYTIPGVVRVLLEDSSGSS